MCIRDRCIVAVGGIALIRYRLANRLDHFLWYERPHAPDVLIRQAICFVQRDRRIGGRMREVASWNRLDRNLIDLPAAAQIFSGEPQVHLLEVIAEMAGIKACLLYTSRCV